MTTYIYSTKLLKALVVRGVKFVLVLLVVCFVLFYASKAHYTECLDKSMGQRRECCCIPCKFR